MGSRVIGIGGAAAGDDGVGLAVVDALRTIGVPGDVELLAIAEPTALVDLLDGAEHVVLVDAVIGGGEAGDLVVLRASDLRKGRVRPLSSHGVGVVAALALARAIHGASAPRDVWIVGVCIGRVERGIPGLSPAVAAAVPRAADAVCERLRIVALRS